MSLPLPGEPTGFPGRQMEFAEQMQGALDGRDHLDWDVMIHATDSESHRNREDGTLFVRRQPHEVRPPSETGVRCQFTSDGNVNLHLEHPPQRAEHEVQAIQLHTYHKLCQACIDCLNYYCKYMKTASEVCKSQQVQAAGELTEAVPQSEQKTTTLRFPWRMP